MIEVFLFRFSIYIFFENSFVIVIKEVSSERDKWEREQRLG